MNAKRSSCALSHTLLNSKSILMANTSSLVWKSTSLQSLSKEALSASLGEIGAQILSQPTYPLFPPPLFFLSFYHSFVKCLTHFLSQTSIDNIITTPYFLDT